MEKGIWNLSPLYDSFDSKKYINDVASLKERISDLNSYL